MKFLDKIDTEEALIQAISAEDKEDPVYALSNVQAEAVSRGFATSRKDVSFWWSREQLRIKYGYYNLTEVLEDLNLRFPICAHISLTDTTMVAFTPDRTSGMADRQVTTTPGRLFSKYMPVVTDSYIQTLVAEHLAEANQVVEFIEGPAIAETYANGMGGIGACMSAKTWGGQPQPTLAYDAPGIKLAVLRDHTGTITARCMVYEASETDKRWIRTYGDKLRIQLMLEKLGYKMGTWSGAKFKAVPIKVSDDRKRDRLAFPYLDCNNGYTNANFNTVLYLDNQLVALTPEQYMMANDLLLTTGLGHSGGELTLPHYTSEELHRVDGLTGEKVDLFGGEKVEGVELLKGGEVVWTQKKNIPVGWIPAKDIDRGVKVLYADPALCFTHGTTVYVESDAARRHCGHARLASKFYPEGGWYTGRVSVTKNGDIIKREDAVFLVDDATSHGIIHKSELPAKSVALVKDPDRLFVAYATAGSVIYRTPSGKKVHPSYHTNIIQLWDDTYDFSRNVRIKHGRLFGLNYAARDDAHANEFMASGKLKQRIKEAYDLDTNTSNFFNFLATVTSYWYADLSIEDAAAAETIERMKGTRGYVSLSQMRREDTANVLTLLTHGSTLHNNPQRQLVLELAAEWAEKEAIERAAKQAGLLQKLGHAPYANDFFKVGDKVRVARIDVEDYRCDYNIVHYPHLLGLEATVSTVSEQSGHVLIRLEGQGSLVFPPNTLEPVVEQATEPEMVAVALPVAAPGTEAVAEPVALPVAAPVSAPVPSVSFDERFAFPA